MQNEIVLITGNFNVLHPGHIRLFKFAKNLGKKLIVGVFSDEIAGAAVNSQQEFRIEAVASIGLIDEVVLINMSLPDFIKELKPAIVVKGKEFENKFNPELDILQTYGGQIIFSSGDVGYYSDNEEPKSLSVPDLTKDIIQSYMQRHNITQKRLSKIVDDFTNKRVCVLGDIIIDEYIDCFPLGMSQEDPTLVVSPQEIKQYLGGAGIVASHASMLGAVVNLLSVTGHDKQRDFAATVLDEYNVNYSLAIDNTRSTTLKQRFRSHGKSLLRVSTLSQQAISTRLQELILSEFEKMASNFDAVIFSDFNYGCLPQNLVNKLISIAKENNAFIAADSQSSSQLGDISRFKGADLITPTEREARLSVKNSDDGLVVLADKVIAETNSKYILLKLGKDGMIAHHSGSGSIQPDTERLPALNFTPVDVSGAGDSVLITSTLALTAGATLWESSLLGSIAAYVQVGRVGNIPLTKTELLSAIS